MFCKNCGTDIPDGQNFCSVCGAAANTPNAPSNEENTENITNSVEYAPQYAESQPVPAQQYAAPQPAVPVQQYATPQYTAPQPAVPVQQYAAAQPAAPVQQYAAPQYGAPQPVPAQQYPQPQYPVNVNVYNQVYAPSSIRLATNRKLVKHFFFSILTLGIYNIVFFTNISNSINVAASRYDGKKTMNYCLVTFLFSWLTCGILPFIWIITLSSRIGNELKRRGINYYFGAGAFWLWNVLGSLFIAGPFIYIHKLCTAMNLICKDYNIKGQ